MQRLSYTHGPGGKLIYRTIPNLLDKRSAEIPEKSAHIFRYRLPQDGSKNTISGRTVLTFQQLADRSFNVAASLLGLGLKPGDRIAVMGGNCPEWLYLEYACFRVGVLLIKVPSNFCSAELLQGIIQRTNSKMLVVDPKNSLQLLTNMFPKILSGSRENLTECGLGIIENVLLLQRSERDSTVSCISITNMASMLPDADHIEKLKAIQMKMNPDDPALVLQTSGSTGNSKSVTFSHFQCANTFIHAGMENITKDLQDLILFNDRPFAWIASFSFLPVLASSTLIHFDPAETIAGNAASLLFGVLQEEKATAAVLLQYLLFDVMQANKTETSIIIPHTLKNIATGGERIPTEILQFALDTFDSVKIAYSATECPALAKAEPKNDEEGKLNISWFEVYSYVELKLVDDEQSIVPVGEIGTVHIRSPLAMTGYLYDDLFKPLPGRWINTNDLAIMREDGCFEIVGRTTDVISRGAAKLYPKTLENVLYKHPKVDKAVVVGVPDPRLFQEACACVIPKSGVILIDQELKQFIEEQVLADSTSFVPKYYLMMDKLPRGTTGKLDRKSLTAQAIKHFKLGSP